MTSNYHEAEETLGDFLEQPLTDNGIAKMALGTPEVQEEAQRLFGHLPPEGQPIDHVQVIATETNKPVLDITTFRLCGDPQSEPLYFQSEKILGLQKAPIVLNSLIRAGVDVPDQFWKLHKSTCSGKFRYQMG